MPGTNPKVFYALLSTYYNRAIKGNYMRDWELAKLLFVY